MATAGASRTGATGGASNGLHPYRFTFKRHNPANFNNCHWELTPRGHAQGLSNEPRGGERDLAYYRHQNTGPGNDASP